ncbi:MAG: hypothetical protein GF308_09310 [Candidatus Heimdallarchaeota archaeon]|nr:hypothetical protein [Candidatus Heimdallarchaeota archaeon]
MKEILKPRKFVIILSIWLISSTVINYIAIQGFVGEQENILYSTKQEKVNVSDFSSFQLKEDSSGIWSDNTAHKMIFNSTQGSFFEDSIESYYLNFDSLWGNCSEIEIEIEVNQNSTDIWFGTFIFELGSHYNLRGERSAYLNFIGRGLFQRGNVEIQAVRKMERNEYLSHNYPTNSTLFYRIKKNGRTLECSIRNANQTLVHKKWRSSNFYIPANYLLISLDTTENTFFEVTAINGSLTIENQNWQALRTRDNVILGLIIGVSIITIITIGAFVIRARIKQEQQRKRETSTWKVSPEEFVRRVEEAVERAKRRKKDQEVDIELVPTQFEGDIKDEFCMICKLNFSKSQEILQCPLCLSLYHQDHLLQWLTEQKKCPVCREPMKKS